MYDECGGDSDDCDEDETVLALAWVGARPPTQPTLACVGFRSSCRWFGVPCNPGRSPPPVAGTPVQVPPVYVDWYVAVEPVEPELTQVRPHPGPRPFPPPPTPAPEVLALHGC
jgi:hypothetical protein